MPPASAQEWIGPVDGLWGTDLNWNPNIVPGATDTALFTGDSTIDLDGMTRQIATFDIGANTVQITGNQILQLNSGAGDGILGSGTLVITPGSTLDVHNRSQNNETFMVQVSGAGVGGNGAIINTAGGQVNALRNVELLGPTTFGGSGRWDIRGGGGVSPAQFNMNGHTLTKTGGNEVALVGVNLVNPGDIIINQGLFRIETSTAVPLKSGGERVLATVNGGTLDFWNNNVVKEMNVVLNAGATISTNGGTGGTITGTVTTNAANTNFNINNPITIVGGIDGPGTINKNGGATLTLGTAPTNAGGAVVNSGAIVVQDNWSPGTAVSGRGAIGVTAGNTLQLGGAGEQRIGGLTAGGTVVKSGAGDLVLDAGSSGGFAGTLQLNEGRLVLNNHFQPGSANALVQAANGTTIAFDNEGLRRAQFGGAADFTTPNTSQFNVPFVDRDTTSTTLFPNNTTFAYNAYLLNQSGGPLEVSFAEQFDDNVLLRVNGTTVLEDFTWNVPTAGTVTLQPGENHFELRLGQAGGGVGANTGWSTWGVGFAIGNTGGSTNQVDYSAIATLGDHPDLALAWTKEIIHGANTEVNGVVGFDTSGMLGDGARGVIQGQLSGSGTAVKTGDADLVLSSTSAGFTGTMEVAEGRLVVNHTGALANGTIQLGSDGVLAFENAGLLRGQLGGPFNEATPNPGQLTVSHVDRDTTSTILFPNNTTFVYNGFLNNDTGVAQLVSFAEQFDDNVLLLINGQEILRDTVWNVPTAGSAMLDPGLNSFELRLGQGGGGVGANTGWGTWGVGFALGATGGSTTQAAYQAMATIGDVFPLVSTMEVVTGADLAISGNARVDTSGLVGDSNLSPRAVHTGLVTGSGTLVKSGEHDLLLRGANDHTGGTRVEQGLVVVDNDLGFGSGTITLAAGAGIGFDNHGLLRGQLAGSFNTGSPNPGTDLVSFIDRDTTSTTLFPNDTTFVYNGFVHNETGVAQLLSFAEQFDDGVLLVINGDTIINNNQWNVATGGEVTLNPGANSFELRLGQGGGGVGASVGGGGGDTGGPWSVYGVGYAFGSTGGNLTQGPYDPIADLGNDFALTINDGIHVANNIELEGGVSVVDTSGLGGASTGELSGVISGPGGLEKTGAGMLILSGANDYQGPTIVSGGLMRINGSHHADGDYLVGSGAALEINGLFGVGTDPLTPTEILFTNLGTTDVTGTFELGLFNPGISDRVVFGPGGNGLNLVAGSTLHITDPLGLAAGFGFGDSWQVFNYNPPFNGEFDNLILPELSGGLHWDTSQLYSSGLLMVLPEPGRAMLLAIAALGLLARRRRG